MARPKKSDAPDLSVAHDLTAGLIERLCCPPGKSQVFLRDSRSPGLRVRATPPSTKNPDGVKAFVFEAKVKRETVRRTIGDVRGWSIEEARIEANKLRVQVDQGTDPREVARQKEAEAAERQARVAANAVTFGEAWSVYVEARKPFWGEQSIETHVSVVHLGGEPRKRWKGKVTIAGPLAPLVPMRLADISTDVLFELVRNEAAKAVVREAAKPDKDETEKPKARLGRVRSAFRILSVFFNWCAEDKQFRSIVKENPADTKGLRELLGSDGVRNDVLQREQLFAWFTQVQLIPNAIISAYLQCVLLTGVRRDELLSLRWEQVDLIWNKLVVKDKIHPSREVPLTPYVKHLLEGLPRVNEWVFPSIRTVSLDEKHLRRRKRYGELHGTSTQLGSVVIRSASGHIEEPAVAHTGACTAVGITLTLHGLRRSFATLSEWVDLPAGVAAQIQGHAPQGVREQHYIHRPLDILRMHHKRFEAWVLEQAGLDFTPEPAAKQLRLAATNGARA